MFFGEQHFVTPWNGFIFKLIIIIGIGTQGLLICVSFVKSRTLKEAHQVYSISTYLGSVLKFPVLRLVLLYSLISSLHQSSGREIGILSSFYASMELY